MAEKDENLREEIDRNKDKESNKALQESLPEEIKNGQTEVKNANAAGLGAMGRNDENDPGAKSPGKEEKVEKY